MKKRESVPESNSSTDAGFVVGRLGRPHGLDGFLGLYVDEPDATHFEVGKSVTIDSNPYTVRSIRRTDRGHQVQFEGVASREQAELLRGKEVFVGERRQLEADEFWPEQLVGLRVVDGEGNLIGSVDRWIPGSAQDRLLVDVDGAKYEIPFVADLVPVVDLDEGYVEVRPIPGLIEPLA